MNSIAMEPYFVKSAMLMFFLLNPFFMSIYMTEFYRTLDLKTFASVMFRGTAIAICVFIAFAGAGDRIFQDLLHVRFSSFLIFGGVIFFIMGIKFVFHGEEALASWRGSPEHIAGAVAMPFMIGPGTVGASVLAGGRLPFYQAALSILLSVSLASIAIVLLKMVYDAVKIRNEKLVKRYFEIVGRIMALVVGTFALEMITQGVEIWLNIKP